MLAQRDSYLALHRSLFGPDCAVNNDYVALTVCCLPNGVYASY